MEGNRIYFSGENAGEFFAASLVSSFFGFLSSLAGGLSRNTNYQENDERLGELLAENTRLLNEIEAKKRENEEREREEKEIKIKKK